MLRTLVPRTISTLRAAARHVNGLPNELGQPLEFAALEDRVLLNAAPVDASVDGGAEGGAAAGGDADGGWIVVEDYSGATSDVHNPQSGGWALVDGEYQATPGSDAVSTLNLAGPLGENLELEVSINMNNPSGSNLSNAFVIFDYHSATDFKFAGAYQGVDQWVIGHRTASDWVTDTYVVAPIHALTDYNLALHVVGNSQVTLHVGGSPAVTHTFADSVTDGQLGVGTKSAIARFDDLRLRFLPSSTGGSPGGLPLFEDFNDGVADQFSPEAGNWHLVDGHYQVTPAIQGPGASALLLSGGVPQDVSVGVTFEADPIVPNRFSNGVIIFDYQNENDFKYAGGFANRDQWVIGHKTGANWIDDVTVAGTILETTAYDMRVEIHDGSAVTLFASGAEVASWTFVDSVVDGSIGLGSNNSVTRFDNFSVVDLSPPPPPPPPDLPVSNISAVLDGRDLVVSGHAAGELLVQALSSTTFNIFDGDDLLYESFEVKGNLRFDLGEWNDHVTLDLNGHEFLRSVFAGLGEGDNYFEVAGGAIAKSLNVLAGGGLDHVVITDGVTVGKHVDVDLGGGANQFSATGNKVGGHLKVTGGSDDDRVTVEDARIEGTLNLALGDGENEARVADAKVGGHLKVLGGAEEDHVVVDDVHVRRDLVVQLGDGANDAGVSDSRVGGRLHVSGGSGGDVVAVEDVSVCGTLVAKLGDGDNGFGIADAKVGGDLKVKTGEGVDSVSIAKDVKAGHHVRLWTGAGNDAIDFAGKAGWGLFVHAGAGEDALLVSGSVGCGSYIHMGAGDDRVEVVKGASLGRYAEIRLGAGDDTFIGPKGKHCWTVYGGRGDDEIDWIGAKSKSKYA